MFISEQLHIVDIAAGSWHSIVLTDSGDAYGFGWNNNGQLGYPTSDISIVSTPYPFDLQENVTGVCCIHNTTNLTFENSETIIFGSNCSL
jgi:alpha-tubulin suppressor-like RCC1 family protein